MGEADTLTVFWALTDSSPRGQTGSHPPCWDRWKGLSIVHCSLTQRSWDQILENVDVVRCRERPEANKWHVSIAP